MSGPAPAHRRRLPGPFALVAGTVLVLLHGLPWWVLLLAPRWPSWLFWTGTAVILVALGTFPVAMIRGHGRRHQDGWAIAGDSWLGVIWLLFSWSVIGGVIDIGLRLGGAPSPAAQRWTAAAVLVIVRSLGSWGLWQARRVPRVRRVRHGCRRRPGRDPPDQLVRGFRQPPLHPVQIVHVQRRHPQVVAVRQ